MRTLMPLCVPALVVSLGPVLPGQDDKPDLGPRSFFPREYTRECFVDLDALQDTALWDAMERSAIAGPLRMKFRQEFGFRIEGVTSVRTAGRFIAEKENSPAGPRDVNVTVIQGKKVCLPPGAGKKSSGWLKLEATKIGAFDVVREAPDSKWSNWPEGRLYVVPRPGCLVIGSEEMIQSVLEGKRRGGVIDSRLMALTAIRKPLAYVAMGFPPPDSPRYGKDLPFDANWFTEDDPLEHLIARLLYDEKTEKLTLRATLRFRSGEKGPALLEESAKATLKAFKAQGNAVIARLVTSYFGKLRWKRDGVDLHVTMDVRPGDMTGLFGASGLLGFFALSSAGPVMQAPAAVQVAAPAKLQKVEAKPARKPDDKPARKREPDEKPARNRDEKPARKRKPDEKPARKRKPDEKPARKREPDEVPPEKCPGDGAGKPPAPASRPVKKQG